MPLWTDVIDPATQTGYARAALKEFDEKNNLLSTFLPNKTIPNIVASFDQADNGLVEAAEYRAYDAEIEVGERKAASRKYIELPALGQKMPLGEYDQLRLRNAGDKEVLNQIKLDTKKVAQAIASRMEYQRGVVISTGKATIDQARFQVADDFGRSPGMNLTATTLWDVDGVDIIDDLVSWTEAYKGHNGEAPGTVLMSQKIYRRLRHGANLTNSQTGRPLSNREIEDMLSDYGVPQVKVYDRKVKLRKQGLVRTTPENQLFLLPSSTGENNPSGTQLGASFWGQTLTSSELSWGIEPGFRPGIVTGMYRNEEPPVVATVIADAIGMPVLANADLAMAVKVLA